ncbi:MAG TPA: DASS family sodium-coupled anion symporter [Euryarchaeota archaeon]|nr:sodium-dependent dicarboxylate transporter SdcS [archaeon BMS3Abin16]HDH28613.1 DASS family sodium-coupled anion symporter [Euryarchaeota archaeon]
MDSKPSFPSRGLIIGFSLALLSLVLLLPTPQGLSVEGQRVVAIFVMAIVLWASAALPLSVTGILVIAALPLLGAMDAKTSYSLFGSPAVFFILGAFILAAAMMKTGLSMRLSLQVLKRFGKSPSMLIAGVLFTSASMAFIMPEHAVAAIMFPVVLDIALALELEPMKSRYGTLLFLALAWGSVIGGIATLLGGARNPLAIALLSEYYGLEVGFFQWAVIAVPVTIIMLFVAFAVLILYFGLDVTDVSKAVSTLERDLLDQGDMSSDEKKVGLVMLATLLLWIVVGNRLGLANIALISSVFLFSLGVMDWKDVEGYVNWGVILMYGGAIALGSALVSTGAAQWITDLFLTRVSLSPLSFLFALSLLAIFLTEGISNTATVAIVLPIGFSVGAALGINPIATVFIVALPSGLAFTLPIATPPNAIAYSSGYYEISDVIKPGLMLNMLAWIIFIIIALVYWPMIGLNVL